MISFLLLLTGGAFLGGCAGKYNVPLWETVVIGSIFYISYCIK